MKRIFIIAFAVLTFAGCEQTKYGQGGRNACQFVKERVPELREDIESVEVIEVDSLMSDFIMYFKEKETAKAGTDLVEGKIKLAEYHNIVRDAEQTLNDINNSWAYGIVVNDSLRKLEKYKGFWRVVYKVKVTMKSGTTRTPRVLMEADGVTPTMIEKDFEKSLTEHYYNLRSCQVDTIGFE